MFFCVGGEDVCVFDVDEYLDGDQYYVVYLVYYVVQVWVVFVLDVGGEDVQFEGEQVDQDEQEQWDDFGYGGDGVDECCFFDFVQYQEMQGLEQD